MSDTPPDREQTQSPVEPLYTHPASPFMRTESNLPPEVSQMPGPRPRQVQSTWVLYRAQIEIGLALLAYMMLLVGSVTILRANPDASWRYVVALVPVAPAALVLFLNVLVFIHGSGKFSLDYAIAKAERKDQLAEPKPAS